MIIAIDYDDTWTLDPHFWLNFVDQIIASGHQAIIVTGRDITQPIPTAGIPIVYAGNDFKKSAAERGGYKVDVWIDDEPGHIEPCRKLEW